MGLPGPCVVAALAAAWMALAAGGCLSDHPRGNPGGRHAHAGRKPADNSYCYVCHRNYEEEALTRKHARAGIGCDKCHGASDCHSGDEDGLTPPEIMFSRAKIIPYCMTCHSGDKVMKAASHKDLAAANAAGKKVCTDCHGEHRLDVRTRIWDKDTGRLVSDDGVRMIQKKTAS